MEIPGHLFGESEIKLIDLYDTDPEFTHFLVHNSPLFPTLLSRKILQLPRSFVIPTLNSSTVNRLVTVEGTVVKTGTVLLNNVEAIYFCGVCRQNSRTSCCEKCENQDTIKDHYFAEAKNCQTIRLQNIGANGGLCETLEIILDHNHAGNVFPGEGVVITGVVILKINKIMDRIRPILMLEAKHVVKREKSQNSVDDSLINIYMSMDHFSRREFLVKSFASEILNQFHVKLGLLISMAMGTCYNNCGDDKSGCDDKNECDDKCNKDSKCNKDIKDSKYNKDSNNDIKCGDDKGTDQKRANIHVLLVGDPGTGKFSLMASCIKLISPSVMTNGTNTTEAGLTTCAVRQGKDWSLEAGAIVFADGGLCCIDEIEELKTTDRSGLLESMEQQTISVAKAGLIATLNARTTIIASCSGNYNSMEELIECSKLGSPLISRFDLIFSLEDKRIYDNDIADLILGENEKSELWNSTNLKNLFQLIRNKKVRMKEDQKMMLLKYYNIKRKSNAAYSVRLLEGLIRVTQAHAKLMMNDEVEDEDVLSAIILMECGVDGGKIIEFNSEEVFRDTDIYIRTKEDIMDL